MADEPTPQTPAPTPAPPPAAPAPAPQQPAPPAPAATPLPPVNVPGQTEAMSSMAAQLTRMFPSGVLPQPVPVRPAMPTVPAPFPDPNTQPVAPVQPTPPAQPVAPTPPVEPTKPAEPAKPAEPTPPVEPKPGDKEPPKPPTKEELDAAEKAMPLQAGTAFKIVRGDLAKTEAKLAEVEARLEASERKASAIDEAEVQALKDQIKGYEEEMAIIRIESTKEFKNAITKPLEKAKTDLASLASKYKVEESDLRSALSESDPAKRSDRLSELSANFNRLDTVRFDQLIVETERLEGEKAAMLGSASEKYSQMQREREQAQIEAQRNFDRDWKKALDAAEAKMSQEFAPVFTKTGDEKWDAAFEKAISGVKATDITRLSNEDIAKAMYAQGTFPLVLNLVSTLHNENEQLNETITKLRGGTPPVGGGDPPPPPPATPVIPEGASFQDVARQKLQGILPP